MGGLTALPSALIIPGSRSKRWILVDRYYPPRGVLVRRSSKGIKKAHLIKSSQQESPIRLTPSDTLDAVQMLRPPNAMLAAIYALDSAPDAMRHEQMVSSHQEAQQTPHRQPTHKHQSHESTRRLPLFHLYPLARAHHTRRT